MNRFGGGVGGYGMNQPVPLGQTTQQAFMILDQVVQAFGGFAQMLESTFHATHSSFMAMMAVAEHMDQLKDTFKGIFSFLNIYRWIKRIITGRDTKIDSKEFDKFSEKKVSKKPLWIFLFVAFVVPWAMIRLVQILKRKQVSAKISFCRALYDFQGQDPSELSFKRGDILAILSKSVSGTGGVDSWWHARTQSGQIGLIPANYVECIVEETLKDEAAE